MVGAGLVEGVVPGVGGVAGGDDFPVLDAELEGADDFVHGRERVRDVDIVRVAEGAEGLGLAVVVVCVHGSFRYVC